MKQKPIPSLPGYVAREDGSILCLPFEKSMPNGGTRTYVGKPVFGQWDGERFIIRRKGKTYKVARLICEAFHGPPPPKSVCMHLDENSKNNRPENLAWGTQKQNLNARGFIEYCKTRTGENSPAIKGKKRNERRSPHQ